MMRLSALQDLFQRHREGASGQWRLGSDPQRNIFFEKGRIVFAQSTHPLDRLTHLLVEKGRLTQDQMDYAMSNLQPGMSVGKNLIQLGFITQRDLLDMAKLQVERVVWGAIGTADGAPDFTVKDLDNTVVRLNLDTAALLLGGLLNLKDRERLLELLGPLSQVMVLDRLKLTGLDLPSDLARIPNLINGRRTLLELSREAAAEPVRLGAFVLFLREMGWGHLQDQPEPTTQDLLNLPLGGEGDLAPPLTVPQPLQPEPEPLALIPPIISPSEVPAPPDEPTPVTPPLFHSIQAASSPTHNLEHLSAALDEQVPGPGPAYPGESAFLEEDEEEEDTALPVSGAGRPAVPGYTLESGQAVLPTPRGGLSALPLPPEMPDPALIAFGEAPESQAPRKGSSGLGWGLVAFLALSGGFGYWWSHRDSGGAPPKELVVPSPDSKGGVGTTPIPSPVPAGPKPETPPQTAPAQVPVPPPATPTKLPASAPPAAGSPALNKTYLQGQAHRSSLPEASWTLRLEIACQSDTVQHAAQLLEGTGEATFNLPIKMRDGKTCTQIFSGSFKSREEAEAHIRKLPAAFLVGGNKPSAFRISDIPDKQ